MRGFNLVLALCWFVLAAASFAALLLYQLHMFQLNSYMPDEHKRFMRDHKGALLGRVMGVWLSVFLAGCSRVGLVLSGILLWMTFWGNRPWGRVAKRPLAYTGRVKRLITTSSLLFFIVWAACLCWMIISRSTFIISFWHLPVLAVLLLVPYLLFLANLINHPLEEKINQGFIDEAKKIIADSPELLVIGITGSFGKTSMKYFLTKLLSGSYRVLMTPGNYNTVLGVTKTVREMLKPTHQIFVCEMGARRVGEIKGVCDIVSPKIGILTSIGAQHLETFGSMENIKKTKFELADAVGSEGTLFFNVDNEVLRNSKAEGTLYTYGVDQPADFMPRNVHCTEKGSEFTIGLPDGTELSVVTPLIGKINVLNLCGAIACAWYLKVPGDVITEQAKKLEPVPHRMQLVKSARGLIIDDAYNSNPSGAKAALETLSLFDGLHVIITPGMVELGEKQDSLNEELGREAAKHCDVIVLVGEKQTAPIAKGVRAAGFPEEKLIIAPGITEALAKVEAIRSDKQKIILLENDLPDNY